LQVASRATLQITGVMMIVLGIFTKFGAILATIPEPLVGGILTFSMSIVGGVGLSSLQLVDLKMSRNVAILGFSIMCGMLVPAYFTKHPVNTCSFRKRSFPLSINIFCLQLSLSSMKFSIFC
jgi:nucleobase transporter 1/2